MNSPPPPPPPPPPQNRLQRSQPPPSPPQATSTLIPPLSAVQASLSNFFAKKRHVEQQQRNFADKLRPTLEDIQCLGLTRAMRALDSLRRHNATPAEEDALGASGRLDVQDRAELMALCGCKRGCRLTSDEMKTIQCVTQVMAEVFSGLELQFKNLAPKMRGSNDEQAAHQGELGTFFEAADTWLTLYDEVRALAGRKQAELRRGQTSSPGARGEIGSPGRTGRALPFPAWLSTLMERYQVERRDENAEPGGNSPVAKSGTLPSPSPASSSKRGRAQTKRDEEEPGPSQHQTSSDAPRTTAVSEETASVGECQSPPDVRQTGQAVGRKRPDTAAPRAKDGVASDSAPPSVDSLARFSRFLSLLVVSALEQTPSTTERERVALAELVRASDDGSDREAFGLVGTGNDDGGGSGRKDGDSEETDEMPQPVSPPRTPTRLERRLKASSSPGGSPGSPRPLRYWARRIHRFLLSVRELRTVPERDTESLEKCLSEIRRADGRQGRRSPSSSPLRFRRELPGSERSRGIEPPTQDEGC